MTGGHANMEVKNCKECGRLFNYMGGAPLCDGCRKKLEQKPLEPQKKERDGNKMRFL